MVRDMEVTEKVCLYTYDRYTKLYLSKTEDCILKLHSDTNEIGQLNIKAFSCYFEDDFYGALNYAMKAHEIIANVIDDEEYYYTLKLTGDVYRKFCMYDSSIYYYLEALKRVGTYDDSRKRCDVLRHIGMVYTEIHSLELATDYAVEALQIAELIQDTKLIGEANLSLCRLAAIRKLYDRALKYGAKASEMFESIDATKGLVLICLEIASIYENIDDLESSRGFYEQALMLATEIGYDSGIIHSNLLLGRLMYQEDHNKRALVILEEALRLSRETNIQKHRVEIYFTLADVYASLGDYELAYSAYKTGNELKDFQQADSNKQRIYRLQNEFNLYQKEEELKQYIEQNASLERMNRELEEQAIRDPLTGLLNRRGLRQAIQALDGNGEHVIVVCDIDHFKLINDQYGHPCGDEILAALSVIFEDVRSVDYLIARWGGEEFLMILPQTTMEEAKAYVHQIQSVIKTHQFSCSDSEIRLTLTFGLAMFKDDFEASIQLADQRLYYGKYNGRDQVVSQ
jgi:diguanylate cyclase (GGDEF)-like protein